MKKIILIISILLIFKPVFASDIIERITYTNGIVVLMCEENGVVDYCTEEDRQNSIESLRNPNVSVAKKEIISKQKTKFLGKTYYAQQNIQMGTNLINTIADGARVITSFMGANW